MEMDTLETDRLLLREWNIEDAADVYEYAKSKRVGPMAGWKPHENVEESKQIVQMFTKENDTWALVLKQSSKVIGSVGLHGKDVDERMLGYVLGEDYWGQGMIVEAARKALEYAFDTLKVNRVSVFHYPFNEQSKRVIEKLGFRYVGNKEQSAKIFDGTVYDEVCYLMTREEYR
jgi:ribosomal-protein-alanine N-acetyltransferase